MPRFRNYKLSSPCPACQGYNGAHRKEKRCKGYEDLERGGVYCQRVVTDSYVEPFGVRLYLQPLEVDIEVDTSYPPTTNYNEAYSQTNPKTEEVNLSLTKGEALAPTGLVIEREVVEYPGREGAWGWEPFSREMFVVYRNGVEVARDSSQLRLRGWILESEQGETFT